MTTSETELRDALNRVIVLMYGLMEDGGSYWLFAAVKPSKYQGMLTAQRDGSLDIYNFEGYGEIIVAGKGKTPPEDVTLKVAEMYQTDPALLLKPVE